MKNTFLKWVDSTKLLFRSIPATVVALFTISVVAMNLLANKTIFESEYLAIDGGILVSWISFLCMDITTKHFGPKAATKMSIFAIIVNLITCLIFFIVSIIPKEGFKEFDYIMHGTPLILLSSTIAFLCSSIINNVLNWIIGKLFKKNPDGKLAFVTRSYVSTFIGQFLDNLIFAVLAFILFAPFIFSDGFHWTFIQCVTCSILGGLLELFMEIVFSPIGYIVTKNWKKDNVGEEYLRRMAE